MPVTAAVLIGVVDTGMPVSVAIATTTTSSRSAAFQAGFRQRVYHSFYNATRLLRRGRVRMRIGKTTRVALDVALSLMLVFEVLIQLTSEFLHEVVGFAFFATIVAHLAFSAAWVKKTARNAKAGKLTARRASLAVVDCLLAATTIALGASSVAISGILSSMGFVWPVGNYSTWAAVHTFSAYALCALVVVHLAMHWAFLASAFKVEYNPSRRRAISRGVNAMAALGVLALGVAAAGKVAPQETGTAAKQPVAASSSGRGPATKPGASDSATKPGAGGSPSAGDSTEGGSTSGNSSSSSGVCTLCRKRCSLSAPKCDKPYEAGLL